jgi:hypothetical protein
MESVVDTPFTDSPTPGTQTRNATVQRNQRYVWAVTWCAKDANTLQANLQNIAVRFAVNGTNIDPGLVTQTPAHTLNNLSCVDWLVTLSNFTANPLTLTKTMTLKKPVFDGNTVYAAGDYVYQYNVTVQ